MTAPAGLEAWIDAEYRIAATRMLRSVSATGLVHRRPLFGQAIRPARGSVVASPVPGAYDPEPDYFFHWYRDAAVVAEAVSLLIADGTLAEDGPTMIADMVDFASGLDRLDGRAIAASADHGAAVAESARQFLRPREELLAVTPDSVRAETRCNPDGTIDIIRWARPQFDGAALRALTFMRHAARFGATDAMTRLILADLDFVERHAGAEGFDIWEERRGTDYYTRLVHHAALAAGAAFAAAHGEGERGARLARSAESLLDPLDAHWSAERSAYRSMAGPPPASDRDVDFAVILAVLHAGLDRGRHSALDPKVQASFAALEAVFASDYAINRERPDAAPAMGRYRGDVYQSGGAFYFSTLGAAELHYRLASLAMAGEVIAVTPENRSFLARGGLGEGPVTGAAAAQAFLARGDGFMATVRRFTPPTGELSEQFDQTDGHQSSAKDLAWSYASFITTAAARRAAARAIEHASSGPSAAAARLPTL
jgi:glucoamylase